MEGNETSISYVKKAEGQKGQIMAKYMYSRLTK
jgi:hypothetical protein